MKIFYADHYVLPLPAQHRFPMQKYALLRARVEEEGLATLFATTAKATVCSTTAR